MNWPALVGSIVLAIILISVVFPRVRAHWIGLKVRRFERLVLGEQLDEARELLGTWERRVRARDDGLRILLASLWADIGDHDRAVRVLEGIEILSIPGSKLVKRGVDAAMYPVLLSAKRVEEADRLFAEASERDPSAPWIVAARLRRAREKGDTDAVRAAVEPARRIVAIDKRHFDVSRELYITVAAMGRFDEASGILELMLASGTLASRAPWLFPGRSRWLVILGWARQSAGDEAGAEGAFVEAVRLAADRQAVERLVMVGRARGLFNAGRYADATLALERVLATTPDPVDRLALGECRRRAGRIDDAFALLREARGEGAEPTETDLLEARLLADVGRGAEAEAIALRGAGGEDVFDPVALGVLAYVRATSASPKAEASVYRWATRYPWLAERDDELLDRRAPDGRTWRDHLDLPSRSVVDDGGASGSDREH